MGVLSNSLRIAWKDLLDLFRNRLGLVMLILMPLFMMLMVGFIYPSNNTLSNVPIALANQDAPFTNSTLGIYNSTIGSQKFLYALDLINNQNNQSKMLSISNATDINNIKDLVQRGDVEGGILIPSNFTETLMSQEQETVVIVTDESNPQVSATIQAALTAVFQGMGTTMARLKVGGLLNLNETEAEKNTTTLAIVQPLSIQIEGVVAGHFSYFDFIAPGIVAMTVMMSVMTGLPAAISHEREIGTLDGMMVAPINRLSIILGKTLAQTARGLLQGAIILTLATVLFGVTIHGSILLVIGLLLLGVFSFVGLGVVLTSFAKDQETAMMLMMTLMFPMMFLSGVFFPIQQMPWYMQDISKVLPLTYASSALRKVMVLGAGVPAIATELTVLIVFGVVMTAIALPVFRRAMTA
jgi:ABC-2 type transport system permease protein